MARLLPVSMAMLIGVFKYRRRPLTVARDQLWSETHETQTQV